MKKLISATAGALLLALAVTPIASADFTEAVTSKPTKLTKRDARLISLGCYRGSGPDYNELPPFGKDEVNLQRSESLIALPDVNEAYDTTWTCPESARKKFAYFFLGDQFRLRFRVRTEGCKTIDKTTADCTIRYDLRIKIAGKKELRKYCTVVKRVVLSPAEDQLPFRVVEAKAGGGFIISIVNVTPKDDCFNIGIPDGPPPVIIDNGSQIPL